MAVKPPLIREGFRGDKTRQALAGEGGAGGGVGAFSQGEVAGEQDAVAVAAAGERGRHSEGASITGGRVVLDARGE